MPKLYRKKNGGYYTKTAFRGTIVTYQITLNGANRLIDDYFLDIGDEFSKDLLFELVELNEAYTHGTGPGEIDIILKNEIVPYKNYFENDSNFSFKNRNTPMKTNIDPSPRVNETRVEQDSDGDGCIMAFISVIIIIFCIIVLSIID